MKASSRVTTSPPANMRRGGVRLLAEPPAPTKPHDDGGARGALPAIDGVGGSSWRTAGAARHTRRLQPAAAARAAGRGPVQGAALHDLVVDLGQHAAVADGDGQDGGERSEPRQT